MKPNLLVVQPSQTEADPAIDHFCKSMCGTHYVYLLRPTPPSAKTRPQACVF